MKSLSQDVARRCPQRKACDDASSIAQQRIVTILNEWSTTGSYAGKPAHPGPDHSLCRKRSSCRRPFVYGVCNCAHGETLPRHHGRGLPSRKNPPVGPLSGSVAAHTIPAAPSLTERGAPAPPISVATQPGHTAFTKIRVFRSSPASERVKAFSAAFVT